VASVRLWWWDATSCVVGSLGRISNFRTQGESVVEHQTLSFRRNYLLSFQLGPVRWGWRASTLGCHSGGGSIGVLEACTVLVGKVCARPVDGVLFVGHGDVWVAVNLVLLLRIILINFRNQLFLNGLILNQRPLLFLTLNTLIISANLCRHWFYHRWLRRHLLSSRTFISSGCYAAWPLVAYDNSFLGLSQHFKSHLLLSLVHPIILLSLRRKLLPLVKCKFLKKLTPVYVVLDLPRNVFQRNLMTIFVFADNSWIADRIVIEGKWDILRSCFGSGLFRYLSLISDQSLWIMVLDWRNHRRLWTSPIHIDIRRTLVLRSAIHRKLWGCIL